MPAGCDATAKEGLAMTTRLFRDLFVLVALLGALLLGACSSDSGDDDGGDDVGAACQQGATQPCLCAGGAPGAQVCAVGNVWGACECGDVGDDDDQCQQGATQDCTCTDGASGSQTCAGGTWQACTCTGG